jgi:hypothetical protein
LRGGCAPLADALPPGDGLTCFRVGTDNYKRVTSDPFSFVIDIDGIRRLKLANQIIQEGKMPEKEDESKKSRARNAGGLCIPAGLFIGMGIGWSMGYLVQGMFIGLGVGFLLFAIVILTIRD